MIIEGALNLAVRTFIDTVISSGYAIRASQNAPRPVNPYCTVNTISIITTGNDWVTHDNEVGPDTDLEETIQGLRLVTFSINFFKTGAYDNAALVYSALQRTSASQYFKSLNMGFSNRSNIRNVTLEVDAALEQRTQFDLDMYTTATDNEVVYAIEKTNVIVNTYNGTDSYTNILDIQEA